MLDQDGFIQKIDAYSGQMYRVARSLLCGEEDCKDALQEAITKAWAARHSLRREEYFGTWITRIVINECRNIQRCRARIMLAEEAEPVANGAAEDVVPSVREQEILALVDRLPEKQRIAVVLHYVEGLAIEEVAHCLRVPKSTVRGRLFEARKALKLELNKQEEVLAE